MRFLEHLYIYFNIIGDDIVCVDMHYVNICIIILNIVLLKLYLITNNCKNILNS